MSSKMPEKPAKKTASARKSWSSIVTIVLLVFMVVLSSGVTAYLIINKGDPNCDIVIQDTNTFDDGRPRQYSGPHIKCLGLERVSSPEALAQGLSGRVSLPENQGMLFIFDQPGEHCFWMKDMNFPLDIIWLNQDKQVVHIEKDVQPDSYPQTFCPDQDAQYVIEVNAGIADRAYIAEGSQLNF